MLTVERDKIEIYAELANVLYKNLFGHALVKDSSRKTELLGEFLAVWTEVERGLRFLLEDEAKRRGEVSPRLATIGRSLGLAHQKGLLSANDVAKIQEFRKIRNLAAHDQPGWESILSQDMIDKLKSWAKVLGDYTASMVSTITTAE